MSNQNEQAINEADLLVDSSGNPYNLDEFDGKPMKKQDMARLLQQMVDPGQRYTCVELRRMLRLDPSNGRVQKVVREFFVKHKYAEECMVKEGQQSTIGFVFCSTIKTCSPPGLKKNNQLGLHTQESVLRLIKPTTQGIDYDTDTSEDCEREEG